MRKKFYVTHFNVFEVDKTHPTCLSFYSNIKFLLILKNCVEIGFKLEIKWNIWVIDLKLGDYVCDCGNTIGFSYQIIAFNFCPRCEL